MKQSGSADLALFGGKIPSWLYQRMKKLSLAMVESILMEYGHKELISRISDPFWFQSFGAVIGMDWNSSGVTTTVLKALQDSINPISKDIGLYVAGGKGKHSLKTPDQLLQIGEQTGLDGDTLSRASKLVAKVDNTAIQDGYQLYIHSFLLSYNGDWSVIQQGMKPEDGKARRYHWHSESITSFVDEPHSGVIGENHGEILNLTAKEASETRDGITAISTENPEKMVKEIQRVALHGVKGIYPGDVDLKRLGSILWLAQEMENQNFEELLLLKGLGPRTLQSLTLVSEVIHGTQSRFKDPARFAFAHGSKGGNPFPVPTKVYDETIEMLEKSIEATKLDQTEKAKAIKALTKYSQRAEKDFIPKPGQSVEKLLEKERKNSWKHGGRTIKGFEQPPKDQQLGLFD